MLQFFRKHQRIFFLFTTVVIIISFTFFGTFSTFMNQETEVRDVTVTKAVDGSSLKKRQIDLLAHFLSANYEDSLAEDKAKIMNLFNDGVLEKDFLATGLGDLLVDKYFDELKPDLAVRLQKVSAYQPYIHPTAPFINSEAVWGHFDPSLPQSIAVLKQKKDNVDMEAFSLLSYVYINQRKVPSSLLKRILMYQQRQASWIEQDQDLPHMDLALFGFHTVEDWFGPKYLQLISQFILNASSIAKQRGYIVTKQEAKTSLFENLSKGLKALSKDEKVTAADVSEAFYHQLKILGVNEATCIELWQNVLLFRRLFQETGNSVMLDPLMNKEFHSYARQQASVDLYELPRSLQLTDFRSMMRLQVYVDGVSAMKSKSSLLSLPKEYLTLAEAEKKSPELVQKNYSLEFAEVDKNEILLQIGLKDTWQWELDEQNWNLIKNEFPTLAKDANSTRQERFLALEKLDEKERLSVDQFAREQMVEKRPEWLQEALQKAPRKTRTVALCCKEGPSPFKGVAQNTSLMALLDKAPLKGEANSTVEAIATQQKLSRYSGDGKHYYSISVLSRDYNKRILTFAEATRLGIIDAMLDKKLEEAYPDVRRKDAAVFQLKDGTWKPFSEVKDQIGVYVFSDLLRAIEQEYAQFSGKQASSEQKKNLEFYSTYRLVPLLREAKSYLEVNPNDPSWVVSQEAVHQGTDLTKQWLLMKTQKEVSRSTREVFQNDDLFLLPEGQWSSVLANRSGSLLFFQMLKRKQPTPVSYEEVQKTQEMLSLEAQRQLMQEILDLIAEKKAICFTANSEEGV